MMIFMGFLFFKIPSGLCIYFIVSTLWGLAERRFVPKPDPEAASQQTYDVTPERTREKKDRKKNQKEKEPEKEEGFFARLMREVNEKAAEQRKLDKVDKKKKRK